MTNEKDFTMDTNLQKEDNDAINIMTIDMKAYGNLDKEAQGEQNTHGIEDNIVLDIVTMIQDVAIGQSF